MSDELAEVLFAVLENRGTTFTDAVYSEAWLRGAVRFGVETKPYLDRGEA